MWLEVDFDKIIDRLSHDDFADFEGKNLRVFLRDDDAQAQIFLLESGVVSLVNFEPYIRQDIKIVTALEVLGIKTLKKSKVGRPLAILTKDETTIIDDMRKHGSGVNAIAKYLGRGNRVVMRYLQNVSRRPPAAAES